MFHSKVLMGNGPRIELPSFRVATPREVLRKVGHVALPALLLFANALIEGVSAATYVDCIDSCNQHRDAHPLAKLLCYSLCALFAKDPEQQPTNPRIVAPY